MTPKVLPLAFRGSVRNEQTAPGRKDLQKKAIFSDVQSNWRFCDASVRFIVLDFTSEKQAGVRFKKQYPRRLAGDQCEERFQEGVENVVHTQVLGESKRRLAKRVRFRPSGFRHI